jgi:hypothetical protein
MLHVCNDIPIMHHPASSRGRNAHTRKSRLEASGMHIRLFSSQNRAKSSTVPVLRAVAVGDARCSKCGTDERPIYYSRTGLCVNCMFSEFCRLQGESSDQFDFPIFAAWLCETLPPEVLSRLAERAGQSLDQISTRVSAAPAKERSNNDLSLMSLLSAFIAVCATRGMPNTR